MSSSSSTGATVATAPTTINAAASNSAASSSSLPPLNGSTPSASAPTLPRSSSSNTASNSNSSAGPSSSTTSGLSSSAPLSRFPAPPAIADPHKRNVFLSHYQANAGDVTLCLSSRLNANGISTWYDQDMTPWGGANEENMKQGVQRSDVIALIISPRFLTREAVHLEVLEACAQNKDMVVLSEDGVDVKAVIEQGRAWIDPVNWVDPSTGPSLMSPVSTNPADAIFSPGKHPSQNTRLLTGAYLDRLLALPRILLERGEAMETSTIPAIRAALTAKGAVIPPVPLQQRRGTHAAPLLVSPHTVHVLLLSTTGSPLAEFLAHALKTACPSLVLQHYEAPDVLHGAVPFSLPSDFAPPTASTSYASTASTAATLATTNSASAALVVAAATNSASAAAPRAATSPSASAASACASAASFLSAAATNASSSPALDTASYTACIALLEPALFSSSSACDLLKAFHTTGKLTILFDADTTSRGGASFNSLRDATPSSLRDMYWENLANTVHRDVRFRGPLIHALLNKLRVTATNGEGPFTPPPLPKAFDHTLCENLVESMRSALLDTAGPRLLLVGGEGGLGKTSMTAALAADVLIGAAFHDIWWITVGRSATRRDIRTIFNRLLTTLEGRATDTARDILVELGGRVKTALERAQEKPLLIIFDDLSGLYESGEHFRALTSCIPTASTCNTRIIFTTREPEICIKYLPSSVSSLPVPIAQLNNASAIALLSKSAGITHLVDESPISALTECVGRSPYAIQLAARIVKLLKSHASGTDAEKESDTLEEVLQIISTASVKPALSAAAQAASDGSLVVYKAIEAALSQMFSRDERIAFASFAMFAEDADVPIDLLPCVWGRSVADCTALLDKLEEAALIKRGAHHCVQLHDFAWVFANAEIRRGAAAQATFLDNCKATYLSGATNGGWWELAETPGASTSTATEGTSVVATATSPASAVARAYLFQHLAVHMRKAGRGVEYYRLLFSHQWIVAFMSAFGCEAFILDCVEHTASTEWTDRTPKHVAALRLLTQTMRLSAPGLADGVDLPQRLVGQLAGRLRGVAGLGEDMKRLLEGVLRAAELKEISTPPWLFPISNNLQAPGGPFLQALPGHASAVVSICFLPGGIVASASDDSTIRMWDSKSGETTRVLTGHTSGVNSVCSLSNGLIASSSDDNTIRIWDSKSGETARVLKGHTNGVYSVCSLHDGLIASASYDETVRIWDSKSGEVMRVLAGHTNYVVSVCSLSDGFVASASDDETIRIWDSKSGDTTRVLTGHTSGVTSVCSLSDGLIASASWDKTIRIWDSKSGEMSRVLTGHTGYVTGVCCLHDGLIASSSSDNTIRIWDSKSGEMTRVLTGHTDGVNSVCSLPDGLVASASTDKTIRIWDSESGDTTRVLTGHTSVVNSVGSLSDGLIASASWGKTICIWERDTGICKEVVPDSSSRAVEVRQSIESHISFISVSDAFARAKSASMYMDHAITHSFLASACGGPSNILCLFTANFTFHCLELK